MRAANALYDTAPKPGGANPYGLVISAISAWAIASDCKAFHDFPE
jgi:hypothetical protein